MLALLYTKEDIRMKEKSMSALGILLLAVSQPLLAEIQSKEIIYEVDGTSLTGFVAWDDTVQGKRPGVLVVHEWWGHNDYARSRSEDLAKLGYVGFALDMYGDQKLAEHPDDAQKFMKAVTSRFDVMQNRFRLAQAQLGDMEEVDKSKIAAIGYCFGGAVVLNMARANEPLAGVASFHGSLGAATQADEDINVPILVLNGADDPFITAESITAFKKEMDAANADYTFINYPGVKHGFTNPDATETGKKFNMPLEYDAEVDAQSWSEMQSFFSRIFEE